MRCSSIESWKFELSFVHVAKLAQRARTIFLHILLHPRGMETPSFHARAVTSFAGDVLLTAIVSYATKHH
jgi:hypothetical protein